MEETGLGALLPVIGALTAGDDQLRLREDDEPKNPPSSQMHPHLYFVAFSTQCSRLTQSNPTM